MANVTNIGARWVNGSLQYFNKLTGVTLQSFDTNGVHGYQADPVAETAAATISAADIFNGLVTLTHATGSTVALTLDTGANMDLGMPGGFGINQTVEWTLINLSAAAADTGTVTAASGHTVVGTMVVASAHSTTGLLYGNAATFISRRTAANTWVTYRKS